MKRKSRFYVAGHRGVVSSALVRTAQAIRTAAIDSRLMRAKWSFKIGEMDISVTYFKQHCLAIIRRIEKNGVAVEITRHGKVVAQLRPPATPATTKAARPWERLRARGGRLLAEPGESVLRDKDFEALR